MNLAFNDFLLLFLSIVYANVCATYLAGWRDMVHESGRCRPYWLHVGWSVVSFLFVLMAWWGLWHDREVVSHSFLFFVLSMIGPILLYLLAGFLFPGVGSDDRPVSCKAYYFANAPRIFLVFVLLMVTASVTSKLFGQEALFDEKEWFRLIGIVVALLLVVSRRERVHVVLFGVMVVVLGVYLYLYV